MTEWQEKAVGFLSKRGASVKKDVVDERDGSSAGYEVEHWDGRQDAVAKPKTVEATVWVMEGGK